MEHEDPLTLIDRLDPEEIEAQLVELARRRDALRVLLKAARAREKCRAADGAAQEGAAPPAEDDGLT
jgi:hypothetical protein